MLAFRKKLPRGRPKRGRRNDKMLDITRAGIRSLAQKDFEALSMARLAHDAGCSGGTLYARFSDKHSCLQYLIDTAFRSLATAAREELHVTRSIHLGPTAKSRSTGQSCDFQNHHLNAGGIIRATMKLATIRPAAIERFADYRKIISDCAVMMLESNLKERNSSETIRAVMQVVLATITDSVLQQKPGPLSAGSDRMKAALGNIILGYTGIAKVRKWSGSESYSDEESIGNELFDDPPSSGESLYDPEVGAFRRTKARKIAKPNKTKGAKTDAMPSFQTKRRVI
jgi:AcrR family transcriptional regulator